METMRTGESLISAAHCPENSSVVCNLCQEASGKFIDFCFFERSRNSKIKLPTLSGIFMDLSLISSFITSKGHFWGTEKNVVVEFNSSYVLHF